VNTQHHTVPKKTPIPPDAETVYNGTLLQSQRQPGAYYGKANKDEIYRYFSDNHDAAHFSGTFDIKDSTRVPSEIRTMLK